MLLGTVVLLAATTDVHGICVEQLGLYVIALLESCDRDPEQPSVEVGAYAPRVSTP
jgi:hypothetical protein